MFNRLIMFCAQFMITSFFTVLMILYIKNDQPEQFETFMWTFVISFLAIIIQKLDKLLEWTELWTTAEEEENENSV